MRKIVALLLICCLFVGCGEKAEKKDKLEICVTLFPQYDFLRQIAGDRADITLILPPGMESHNFEPGVKDIQKIAQSDMFVYTGASMEPWAQSILDGVDTDVKIIDVSENINKCAHEHNDEHHHDHESDPHIWTSPKNAIIMAQNVLDALCQNDPENADYYKENANKYFEELKKLDREFTELGQRAQGITLCHGGKFSMGYLERDYGFHFLAAYDSCSSFAEPSALRVKEIIDTIEDQGLYGVFCEELNQGRIAQTIGKEANVPVFLLHTCHNLTKAQLESGETYVSLMRKNAQNIRKVLGDA